MKLAKFLFFCAILAGVGYATFWGRSSKQPARAVSTARVEQSQPAAVPVSVPAEPVVAPEAPKSEPALAPAVAEVSPAPAVASAPPATVAAKPQKIKAAGNKPKKELVDPDARVALEFVGADPVAEEYWTAAINNPNIPANERKDLIEDLNEVGIDPKNLTSEDAPLILSRMAIIENNFPFAMDDANADAFAEAYKDLLNMLAKAQTR